MSTRESKLRISVIDGVSGRLGRMQGAISQFHRRNTALLSPLRGTFGRIAAFGGAYLGVTRGVEGTIGAARKLQSALTEIGIKADLTDGQINQLRRGMMGLAPKVNQTTAELLAGVDTMVTLGLSAEQAAAAMPAIGQTATATMSSIADLSAASVAAMQNMQVAPGEIGKMLDAMAEAGNQGAFEMRDMAQHFPGLTASAKSLGIEGVKGITDMAAALQIARRGAGDAGTAANNMANFLQKIMSPTVARNFKKFGVDTTKELEKAHKKGVSPIEHFIQLVDKKTKGGRADLLGQLFGDKQVLEFVRPMLSDFRDYLRIRGDAERASGTVADAYARRMQDAEQKIKAFRIQMENLGTSLGGKLLGPLGNFAGELAHILDTLDKRVGVFDKIKAAADGFAAGFGQDNAASMLGSMGRWLEEGIFGKKFEGEMGAADARVTELARLSNRFREIGRNFRQFAQDVADNPVAKFLAGMAEHGFKLMLAATGISLLAGAVGKLARAMLLLSGASTAVSILKTVAGIGGVLVGGGKAALPAKAPAAAGGSLIGAVLQGVAARLPQIMAAAAVAYGAQRFASETARDNAADDRRAASHRGAERDSMNALAQQRAEIDDALDDQYGARRAARARAGRVDGRRPTHRDAERTSMESYREQGVGFFNSPAWRNIERVGQWFLDMDKAAASRWGMRANTGAATPTPTGEQAQKRVAELHDQIDKSTQTWPQAASRGLQAYIDAIANGGAGAEAEAARIGQQIEKELSVKGHPSVDTGELGRALDLARQLGSAVRNLGAAKLSAPVTDGARAKGGPVRAGGAYLVGERGPELVTFPQAGLVHNALKTGRILRNAALASAMTAFPAAAASSVPAFDISAIKAGVRQPTERAVKAPSISIASGAISITVQAAPGQSPEQIAASVERILLAKLTTLMNSAFHDGVN